MFLFEPCSLKYMHVSNFSINLCFEICVNVEVGVMHSVSSSLLLISKRKHLCHLPSISFLRLKDIHPLYLSSLRFNTWIYKPFVLACHICVNTSTATYLLCRIFHILWLNETDYSFIFLLFFFFEIFEDDVKTLVRKIIS